MEVQAISKSVKISPRKVRLVVDEMKNASLQDALRTLSLARKRAALAIEKTLRSAIANATHNAGLKEEMLVIKKIEVTEGAAIKRFHPSTRGRVHPYKKRSSHIRVILEERQKK